MRPAYAYALLGIGFILLVWGAFFSGNFSSQSKNSMNTFTVTSGAFSEGGTIPSSPYTCDAAEPVSPPLSISGVPAGAKSLALIMDDPDVPKVRVPSGIFTHWVLFNIPPETKEIPQNGSVGIVGANGRATAAYVGPCPPPEYQPAEHRYFFTVYALDTLLPLSPGASREEVEMAMEGHIIGTAVLMGRYQRVSSAQ